MPQSSHDLRRSSTLPANAFQPQPPPEGFIPPAPPPHISTSTASCNTVQGPWMPIPPPTPLVAPLAVPEPVLRSMWAYAAPSLFEASPTPTLSMSPTVTECSSGGYTITCSVQDARASICGTVQCWRVFE
ncbi:hypothetical protein OF83DRAFT_1179704 [Amylostereum chailletii]|nr:hypothetical protein OF83DRAFT_1179704 [Amylostereum chailletii]